MQISPKSTLTALALASLLGGLGTAAQAGGSALSFTSASTLVNPPFTLGYEFTTNSAVTVDALGYFTATGGLVDSHELAIYDANTQAVLAAATINSGDISFTDPNFAYTSIAPVTLAAGGDYIVAGYSGNDPFAFNAVGLTTDPSINFIENRSVPVNDTHVAFPTNTFADNGIGDFGASFHIAAVPEASTTVSLGLLLALGVTGLAVAAKRKKQVA